MSSATAVKARAYASVSDPRAVFEERLPEVLNRAGPSALPDAVAVAFHIEGTGGGSWQIDCRRGQCEVGQVAARPYDCVVRCSSETFMSIVRGELGARAAYLKGGLLLTGDVGLVLRLQGVLRRSA